MPQTSQMPSPTRSPIQRRFSMAMEQTWWTYVAERDPLLLGLVSKFGLDEHEGCRKSLGEGG